jgi:hypothetical protein
MAVVAWAAPALADDLAFVAPEGFHDYTRDSQVDVAAWLKLVGVPDAKPTLFAADDSNGEIHALMIGCVTEVAAGTVERISLDDLRFQVRMRAINEGGKAQVVDATTLQVGGVEVPRITIEETDDGVGERRVAYWLTGAHQIGTVVFASTAANAPFYQEKFDATVKRIAGLHRPPWWAWLRNRLAGTTWEWLMPFTVFLVVSFFGFMARKRRRPAA